MQTPLQDIHINILTDDLQTIENNYGLASAQVLCDYYGGINSEEVNTTEYYRIITSENYSTSLNSSVNSAIGIINVMQSVIGTNTFPKTEAAVIKHQLANTKQNAEYSRNIVIMSPIQKKNYEICKCGHKMTIVPEYSKLHCPNSTCGKIKDIIGTVFRDEQFAIDGQKSKHGGYDTSRHYKFHIERLQALETTSFNEDDMHNIHYVLKRDKYILRQLKCEHIRTVLKDPRVNATKLNDHAPLLVKMLGGDAPPLLDFGENRKLEILFDKVMQRYDIVVPQSGNKPYYPYFIFKIIEILFARSPKIRLLDYIHLQSRDTVIKNDITFKQICDLGEVPELIYRPTDSAGRI